MVFWMVNWSYTFSAPFVTVLLLWEGTLAQVCLWPGLVQPTFLYKICFQKNTSDQQKPVENFIWDNYRHWAVIKSRGPRISELREIPSSLIPCLLVVYTRQLEILATALTNLKLYKCLYSILLQLTCWLFYTIVTDWKGSRIAHNL